MSPKLLLAPGLVIVMLCAGCLAKIDKPRVPRVLDRNAPAVFYNLPDFERDYTAYKTALRSLGAAEAQRLRNYMVNRIKVDIEMNYGAYKSRLFFDRANTSVGADFLELGLGVATAVSNPARVKTVLSTVATGFQGLRLSYDKNLFREKTTEIIITKMEAYRTRIKNHIIKKMEEPVEAYPFEEAWSDLTQFFYAGTLQGGLQALAEDAGKDAAERKAETEDLELFQAPTKAELTSLKTLRASFAKLAQQWEAEHTANPNTAKALADKARGALGELQVQLTGNETDEQVFIMLNAKITETIAKDKRDQLPKLEAAFRKAGILP